MASSRFLSSTRRRLALTIGPALASLRELLASDEAVARNKDRRQRKRRRQRRQRRRRNQSQQPRTPPGGSRPDIVLINVDDMRESDYLALPQTRALLGEQGTTYPNFFLTTPLCAPSRATLLRGQYVHNHGVLRNTGANGGWETFHDSRADRNTIATWLRGAAPAYRTAFVGKYLNGYSATRRGVAPGWSDWFVPVPVSFFDYTLNANGTPEKYGHRPQHYLTDVLARKARNVINSTPADTPLFLYFAPKAPHGPLIPAPRHEGAFANQPLNPPPSFNEADMSDKPAYMQRPELSAAEIAELRQRNRDRLECLLAVDEAIASIVAALERKGRLDNTFFFFVTDNGFLLGQHRRTAKGVPYEEAIRMSMLVRGPGVPAGQTNDAMVANIDLAPTIAALAGVEAPDFVDGRPFLATDGGSATERDALLIEFFAGAEEAGELALLARETATSPYRAIRTADHIYVEYQNAAEERELYDLDADPFQLISRHDDPAFADEVEDLSAWLATLVDCDGDGCRDAENGPPAGAASAARRGP